MTLPADTGGSARIRMIAVLERARDNARVLQVRLAGAAVTVSSGTYTLYDPDGSVVVTASVTAGAGSASYTVLAASVPATLGYGAGYREEWALTLSTGETPIYRIPVVLARRALHCPVTCEDMDERVPALARAFGSAATSLQRFADEAWILVVEHIVRATDFPEAIVDVDSLRAPTLTTALGLAFRALAGSGGQSADTASQQALHYEAQARTALGQIRTRLDNDQDGLADLPDRRSLGMVLRGASGRDTAWRCRTGGW